MAAESERSSGIWILAEGSRGSLLRSTHELSGVARRLADQRGETVSVVVLDAAGLDREALCAALGEADVDEVVFVTAHEGGRGALPSDLADRLDMYLARRQPAVVLADGTPTALEVMARTAIRRDLAGFSGCTNITPDSEGHVVATRALAGNRVSARSRSTRPGPKLIVVPPGVFRLVSSARSPGGRVRIPKSVEVVVEARRGQPGFRVVEDAPADPALVDLEEAPVIVAGGAGMGSAEGFRLLEELATILGGKVGATRPVVERNWASPDALIGHLGSRVAPRLYLACGVSGKRQHLAGMHEADLVVAVNQDTQAPIMKIADVAVVGDASDIVSHLVAALRKEPATDGRAGGER